MEGKPEKSSKKSSEFLTVPRVGLITRGRGRRDQVEENPTSWNAENVGASIPDLGKVAD